MAKLNVLYIQHQLCGRAWKEAKLIHDSGNYVSLIELNEKSNLRDYSIFVEHINLPFERDLRNTLLHKTDIIKSINKIISKNDYDIIHTHNSPDNLGVWIHKSLHPSPMCHDIHDLMSISTIKFSNRYYRLAIRYLYIYWENYLFKNDINLIVPSREMKEYLVKKYNYKKIYIHENKPIKGKVIYKDKINNKNNKINLVYAGGMTLRDGSHRDLIPVFLKLLRLCKDIVIHIYPATYNKEILFAIKKEINQYKRLIYHDPVPQNELISELTQYDWGLLLFPYITKNIEYSSANKMYEYSAAKIPILTNAYGSIQNYVENYKCGIFVSNLDELNCNWLREPPIVNVPESVIYNVPQNIINIYSKVME